MEETGNPFSEKSSDLLSLDTKDIADPSTAQLVGTHLERGKGQFKTFMEKLKSESQHFYQPIKKINKDFFKTITDPAEKSEAQIIKEDCQLFSRLFISYQTRGCDLREFFKHENQPFPLSATGANFMLLPSQILWTSSKPGWTSQSLSHTLTLPSLMDHLW